MISGVSYVGIDNHYIVCCRNGRDGRRDGMNYEKSLEIKKKKYEQLDCEECSEKDCPYRNESAYCPNIEGDNE